MFTKCVFFKFSSPGKAFSKFCARYSTRYDTSMISSSRARDIETNLETVSAVMSCVFRSCSHIFRAT